MVLQTDLFQANQFQANQFQAIKYQVKIEKSLTKIKGLKVC